MHTVPYSIWHDSKILDASHRPSVLVRMSGWEACQPGHSFGPFIRNYYLLHYVVKGKGIFTVNGKNYSISAGDGFLIHPYVSSYYKADDQAPWEYYWVGWEGPCSHEVLQNLHFTADDAVVHCENIRQVTDLFQRIFSCYEKGQNPYELLGYFYLVMSHFMYSIERENPVVAHAVEYIRSHYEQDITVEDVAAALSVSRSHLYRLFQTYLRQSPKQYLLNLRLNKAIGLLESSSLPVGDVAAACGFSDAAHFSHLFKQKTGRTPLQHRKRSVGKFSI